MFRTSRFPLSALAVCLLSFHVAAAAPSPPEIPASTEISWLADYAEAWKAAREQEKMMFIFFFEPGENELRERFESTVLTESEVVRGLQEHVCVKLSTDTKIRVGGKQIVLLEHSCFEDLQGRQGVAILDFAHKDAPCYGRAVGVLPFSETDCCSARQVLASVKHAEEETEDIESWANSGWHTDFAEAVQQAKQEKKMLLVRLKGSRWNLLDRRFDRDTLADPKVREKLQDYVRVVLSIGATVEVEGETAPVAGHPAFEEMLGRPGVAILDFVDPDSELYGRVVSTFPLTRELRYNAEQMLVILGLPRATLTQRTLIYAVRIHPEKPASTNGQIDAYLLSEAQRHSAYQARIRLQGHHRWETRFHQISARLPAGLRAVEVCAESWPGERLVEAAIECVRCWRFSSGHWSAVRADHRFYGYDMRRGSNGIWYATGIFGGR